MGSGVHGFKGSGVQGCIFVHGLHLGCVITTKTSASPGLIQNLQPNWQLFGEMGLVNENFGSLMPSLSLSLNVEPPTWNRSVYKTYTKVPEFFADLYFAG